MIKDYGIGIAFCSSSQIENLTAGRIVTKEASKSRLISFKRCKWQSWNK